MILNKTKLSTLLAGYVSVLSISRIFNPNKTSTIILWMIYHPSYHINLSNYRKVLSATSFMRMKNESVAVISKTRNFHNYMAILCNISSVLKNADICQN